MKKFFSFFLLLFTALPLFPANAQDAKSDTVVEKPTNSRDVFPVLPPSSFCKKEDIIGIWKLIMVYEVPSGREIELYTQKPLQYYVFESDSRYGEFTSILSAISLKDVRRSVVENQRTLQQFSLNKGGMIFFYKDRTAVDSLACFIVAKTFAPFAKGQLLLMPSEKAARGRLLKIYQKVFAELETPPTIIFTSPEPEEPAGK